MVRPAHKSGFTLLELILVMLILAIAAAMVVPSLNALQVGRNTDNAAALMLCLANYAKTEAISEGRVYRMNFDVNAGTVWLTVQDAGVFSPAPSEYGKHFPLPDGIHMDVNMTPQPSTLLVVPTTVTQTAVQQTPPFGQTLAPSNDLMQSPRATVDGLYMEFLSSGRSDPILITLTNRQGRVVNLGSATATESLHVLTTKEMQ